MIDPFYAIDSSAYIFRSYFALEPRWQSRDGRPTETVYGFAAFLLRLLAREKPRYIAAAFDESLGTGFRHRLYSAYKANRALPDQNLAFQLAACRDVAEALGIAAFACSEYEADDYLATLAARAGNRQMVFILSRDKDLAQLIDESTALWDYGYGEAITRDGYLRDKGLSPRLVADFLALVGDTSDNIPGVPGIGAKTATAILSELGAIETWIDTPEILAKLAVRGSGKLPEKIGRYRAQIALARKLTLLRRDLPAVPAMSELHWRGVDIDLAESMFERLGLSGLNKRLLEVAARER